MGGRPLRGAVLLGVAAAAAVAIPTVGRGPLHVGAAGTKNIAYVFDSADFRGPGAGSGTGTCNGGTPSTCAIGISDPDVPGGSIFRAAITGQPLGKGDSGTYTVGSASYTFTNVPLAKLDATPTLLASYDTVMLYQVCTIGATGNAVALKAVNDYLAGGGKVIVMDGDRCAGSRQPDYSKFAFPFTSNNPGARGAAGHYLAVEASTLTTGLTTSYTDTSATNLQGQTTRSDAVGDSNVFVTFAGAWCSAITAKNLNTTGIVEAYARMTGGGLVIFEGEDVNFTDGPTTHLAQMFNDILAQPHNPDGLPCTTSASGITLAPATQSVVLGASATLVATIADVNGKPQTGVATTLTDNAGPDAGKTLSGTTGSDGKVTVSYIPKATGTDTWVASFTDAGGNVHTSNTGTVTVTAPPTPSATPRPTPTASVSAVTAPNTGAAPSQPPSRQGVWFEAVLGLSIFGAALVAGRRRARTARERRRSR